MVNMKKYDCIIWDFNGTIFDDVNIGIESINTLLRKRGLPELTTREEYQSNFGFPIIEWYKKLGFDFDKEDYDEVANEWVAEYLSREKNAPVTEGVIELLEHFKRNGMRQVIISASEITMLTRQLDFLGIGQYFDDVVGKNDVYASGKGEIAKIWRKLNPGEMVFIGDTDHDLETAEHINADCILVACGHQSYERLSSLIPKAQTNLTVVRSMKNIFDL